MQSNVKVMLNTISDFNAGETAILEPFRKENDQVVQINDSDESEEDITVRAEKRRKVDLNRYNDLTYIPPTSNVCERSFSAAR